MNRKDGKTDFLSTKAGVLTGAVVANLLWGSAASCVKLGYRFFQVDSGAVMSQILFAGIRFTLAGVLILLFGSLLSRRPMLPRKGSGGMVITLALVQTVIQYAFFYVGLSRAPGFKGSIITPTSSFFAVLLAALVFRQEKLTGRKILGCLAGFAGVVVVNLGSAGGGGFRFVGEGFLILAAFSYGLSSVLIKRFSEREDPVVLCGWQFTLGGALMTAAGLLGGGRLAASSGAAWGIMAYLGALSAVAYTIWSLLLQRHPVSSVSVYAFLNPVFGVLLSAWLLDEGKILNVPRCVLALLLVCIGVWIVNRPEKKSRSGSSEA